MGRRPILNDHFSIRVPRRALRLGLVLAVVMAIMAPIAVVAAGGTFTDDDDSIFEANIEWLASAGVTLGCNPPTNDNFCPDDNVSRGQMAAFMQRFAQYIDAEDGTPAEADHATSADSATSADTATEADHATSADSATNAGTVDGKNAIDFQPTTNSFDTGGESVSVDGDYTVATAGATVTDGTSFFCFIGQTPTADIRIHASGTVTGLAAGETATFILADDDGFISGTDRIVSSSAGYASFAIDWLYELSPGGNETFSLVATEHSGDDYGVSNGVILVEVLSDTRCKGTILIGLGDDSEPSVVGPDSGA
jgi:hypothetical protein